MSDSHLLHITLEESVLHLTLDHPKVNAFNFELIDALQAALKRAAQDEAVRAVLLTGAGSIFSAGQDITEFRQAGEVPIRYHLLRTYNVLVLQIRRLEKPVLAAINGPVSGAALGIALACDLRIAAEEAQFVVGFAGIGLAPDSAVSLLLPQLVGLGRAAELAYFNAPLSAQQALAWGLVNRVVAGDQLQSEAQAWAIQLAHGPRHAIGLAKRAFNRAILPNLEDVLDYEAHLQEIAGHLPDHKEGVQAFLEKRPPDFG